MKHNNYLLTIKLCITLLTVPFFGLLFTQTSYAQALLHNEVEGIWRAEVIEVTDQETRFIPGTETETTVQSLRAQVIDGPDTGTIIEVEDDFLELDTGDRFYYSHVIFVDSSEAYGVLHRDRSSALYALFGLFVVAVIALSGWQGVRSLIALVGSFFAIFYLLLPGILDGWSPLLLSVIVSALVLFGAIFFTHGINRESAVAYVGTMIAVGITVILAIITANITALTGLASEGATALNLLTRGSVDLSAVLLGAFIIGILGVLDDIAVTQAAVVTELFSTDRNQSRYLVFQKALRVGREHVGALVNTLILAYTGAALPLLLYYYLTASQITVALSNELFATEIIRMIVGSIGLILTVPIVTGLAVWILKDYNPKHSHHKGHSHSHSH